MRPRNLETRLARLEGLSASVSDSEILTWAEDSVTERAADALHEIICLEADGKGTPENAEIAYLIDADLFEQWNKLRRAPREINEAAWYRAVAPAIKEYMRRYGSIGAPMGPLATGRFSLFTRDPSVNGPVYAQGFKRKSY
jgi:hypothetical protein